MAIARERYLIRLYLSPLFGLFSCFRHIFVVSLAASRFVDSQHLDLIDVYGKFSVNRWFFDRRYQD